MSDVISIRRGDVILADLRDRVGSEQKGIRPCVVIQNNIGNECGSTTIVAPLTTNTGKWYMPTHVEIELEELSTVLAEQIVTIDKSRVLQTLSHIDSDDMEKINKALMISIGVQYR